MQKLHDYTVFEIEIHALRRWLAGMAHCDGLTFNSHVELLNFLNKYLPLAPWEQLELNNTRPTHTSKVIYLKEHMGVSYQRIQKLLSMSPNKIQKDLKTGFIPARANNPLYDQLIYEWRKLRPFIPDEVFIRWIN